MRVVSFYSLNAWRCAQGKLAAEGVRLHPAAKGNTPHRAVLHRNLPRPRTRSDPKGELNVFLYYYLLFVTVIATSLSLRLENVCGNVRHLPPLPWLAVSPAAQSLTCARVCAHNVAHGTAHATVCSNAFELISLFNSSW